MEHRSSLGLVQARQALRAAGLPFRCDLERATSTRNEIFLSDRHVIRINNEPNHRLRREAQLYQYLPATSWRPRLIAVGGELGADHLIVERRPGVPLAHAWPDLTIDQRRTAVEELAEGLRAIHATPTPDELPDLELTPHLLDGEAVPPVRPLLDGLERLAADPHLDSGVIALAVEYVIDNWSHLDGFAGNRLIHGDLTFENLLWGGQGLSAIIDFEWSRGAPADLDLDILLRCVALPDAHIAPEHEHRTRAEQYADIPLWLAESYPGLFEHPRLLERLTLYAMSFEVAELLRGDTETSRSDLSPHHPYSRLISLVSSGGHVALVLDRAGVTI